MTNEQSFFLQILSDHLNGRQTDPHEGIDWSVMMTLAQNHQVNGIVYWQCKDFLPDEVGKRLRNKYFSELYYYYNREALYEQVKQALSAAQIPFFTVKGLAVAQYYPIPALRTMGDCDIVVHPEDKEKTHEIMLELGFQGLPKKPNEWVYFKNKMEFEIHDHLLYDEFSNTKLCRQYTDQFAWAKATPTSDGSCYQLDWSFHFLFLLLHVKKHVVHNGIGFRQFMDMTVVLQHCELDLIWLQETLEELGLWRFSQICFALLKQWFELASSIELSELTNSFFEEATKQILENGVFGFDDEANHDNGTINTIIWNRGPIWWTRAKILIESVFPSYRNMRYVPHYAFLNRRPWLLPIAWVYRFYRSIRHRMLSNGKLMLEHAMIPDEKLDARKDALAKWGL